MRCANHAKDQDSVAVLFRAYMYGAEENIKRCTIVDRKSFAKYGTN